MKEKFNQKKGKDHGKHGGFNKYMEGKGGGHSHAPAASMNLGEVNASQKGMRFNIRGMVDRIVQTGGPTIFHVSDGTGMLALKAFEGAGVRSYPEVEIGDVIRSLVTVEEYNGELEGEVSTIVKLSEEEKKEFKVHLGNLERERAKVIPPEFLVESPILDKLKDHFIKAATEIRLAIIQNRPIIVRHHNDTDGYSSGFALERAILPLITEQHKSVKAAWEFYTRAPCNAPMYEIDDSIRDTAHSLSAAAKFSNKMPLVIIADTGSGEEDLFGIKQGRIHGLDFIVVDHHRFDEDFITAETLVHINPFLVGEDGAKYSAGMICTELARFINNKEINVEQIPAMAGMADHIDNPHVMDAYLKIASKKGYNKELLNDIATVIDFVSSKLRFMEAREYIEVLFGEPMEKQKELVKLMSPYIRELEAKGLDIARKTSTQEKVGKTNLVKIYVEQSFSRGTYPKTGKCVSMLHDDVQKSHNLTNVVTIGILPDAITMRATDEANFSVQELIHHLNEKLPHAFVEGGGHKNAGSIKFAPFMQEKILHEFKEFVKKR